MDNAGQEIDPAQEELRRKKQEKLLAKKAAATEAQNQLYRDHLKRERDFSDQTQRKLFADWETLCERIRTEELAEELRQQQRCFGTVVDRKNGHIERLVGVRDEIGAIHTKCLNRLRNIIDYYIRLKDFMSATMLERYESDCQKLLQQFREEVSNKQTYSSTEMQTLDASLEELMAKIKQDELTDREWFLESNLENISAQVEKCEIIRDKKCTEMAKLQQRLRATLDDYFQTVLYPDRKQTYDQLVYYTELEQQAIEGRRRELDELQRKKAQLERTLTLARIGGKRKLQTRRSYRRLLEVKLQLLKEQLQQLDDEHHQRLKSICSFTHHLKAQLTEHLRWGERVAKLGLICTQYETDQDRTYAKRWSSSEEKPHEPADDTFDCLTNKINRIEAINIILREERSRLRHENEQLQSKFKSYCSLQKANAPEKLHLCGQTVETTGASGGRK
uniref:Dynein regulatory complex subunit 2 n=1 Tax=Anopheles farauti TaxID=69004 RepID=A0A182QXT9_9DIPT